MLTPLARMLARWTPGAPRSAAPQSGKGVGEVLAVWAEVVGADVARHAKPFDRTDDTLVVRVTSSAWANQLSLSSTQIMRGLHAAGVEGIGRLRFRTGRTRGTPKPKSAAVEPAPFREFGEPYDEPAASLEDSLARLQRRLTHVRDAKRALGWKQCEQCNAMVPEVERGRCAACATIEASDRSARLQRLMYEAPWLGWRGTAELVDGLSYEEYETNRTALLARWWEILERGRRSGSLRPCSYEARTASSYVLLKTGWLPERVTAAIARNELGDEIYNALWGQN